MSSEILDRYHWHSPTSTNSLQECNIFDPMHKEINIVYSQVKYLNVTIPPTISRATKSTASLIFVLILYKTCLKEKATSSNSLRSEKSRAFGKSPKGYNTDAKIDSPQCMTKVMI